MNGLSARFEATDIVVVSGHARINCYEDYPEALRISVGLVRDGVVNLEVQQIGILHTFGEIQAASEALEEHFTDEDLIEEVHHASKARLEELVNE